MKKISATKYTSALWQVLEKAEKQDYQGIIKNFLRILSRHKALSQLDKIVKKLERLIDDSVGVKQVEVTSVQDLTGELNNLLQRNLAHDLNKKIELTSQVEESIIGGFIVRYDDVLIDSSVSRQLKILSKILNK